MSQLAVWTWLSVGTLIVVPPVVFVFFLRDAARVLRSMEQTRSEGEPVAFFRHEEPAVSLAKREQSGEEPAA